MERAFILADEIPQDQKRRETDRSKPNLNLAKLQTITQGTKPENQERGRRHTGND